MTPTRHQDGFAIGQNVLGPICADFAVRLWLYLRQFSHPEQVVVLFCARGGLRLGSIFRTTLERLELSSPVRTEDFFVSRLVAARLALSTTGQVARQEIGREFEGRTLGTLVSALAPHAVDDPGTDVDPDADRPFTLDALDRLLDPRASHPSAVRFQARLREQNTLFSTHVDTVAAGATELILCDTGLFGSTLRLLREAMPAKHWSAAQFARSAYKPFDRGHFDRTVGLSVERDAYAFTDPTTIALRYWHLFESLFEPGLPSVESFARPVDDAGPVLSNLQVEGWQQRLQPAANEPLFAGITAHLAALAAKDAPALALRAESAWRTLGRLVRYPDRRTAAALNVGAREVNFGQSRTISILAPSGPGSLATRLAGIRASAWREGYCAQAFGPVAAPFQWGLELLHRCRPVIAPLSRLQHPIPLRAVSGKLRALAEFR